MLFPAGHQVKNLPVGEISPASLTSAAPPSVSSAVFAKNGEPSETAKCRHGKPRRSGAALLLCKESYAALICLRRW